MKSIKKEFRKDGGGIMATKEKKYMDTNYIYIIWISSRRIIRRVSVKSGLLWWLAYGNSFGLSSPLELDLSIMKITFGLTFRMNIASIIGMILSIFIYRKV